MSIAFKNYKCHFAGETVILDRLKYINKQTLVIIFAQGVEKKFGEFGNADYGVNKVLC